MGVHCSKLARDRDGRALDEHPGSPSVAPSGVVHHMDHSFGGFALIPPARMSVLVVGAGRTERGRLGVPVRPGEPESCTHP